MSFNIEVSLGDLISAVGFMLAFIVIILTYRQIKIYNRFSKSTLVKDIVETFTKNDRIRKGFYMIEYGGFEHHPSFHKSEDEDKVDSLLSFFDMIGELVNIRMVLLEELKVLHYEMISVYGNNEIKKYLDWLDGYYRNEGINKKAFSNFREISEELKYRYSKSLT